MLGILKMVEGWCNKENFGVNPAKTALKPHMTYWLYTMAVRPMITYSCLVW